MNTGHERGRIAYPTLPDPLTARDLLQDRQDNDWIQACGLPRRLESVMLRIASGATTPVTRSMSYWTRLAVE